MMQVLATTCNSSMDQITAQTEPRPKGSVERSLALLQLLTMSGRAMSLAELSELLELPKTTVHRLCTRLLALEYITRDLNERFYIAGPALRQLAFNALTHDSLSGLRHKLLADLVAKIGETCNFTTRDGATVLYLDRVECQRPWRLTMKIGVRVPLHCTASGKLFLAYMPKSERDRMLSHLPLEPLTNNTLTNRKALDAALKLTRQRGYGFDQEEFIPGLIALAVPVHDKNQDIRAALAMHCPTSEVSEKQALNNLGQLKQIAAKMGQLL